MNCWKKTGLLLLTVAVAYTLIGFFVIPPVFKSILAHKLSARLHRKVSIQSVEINPYVLSVTINKLNVRQKNGSATFASIDRIYANLQAVSIVKGAWVSKTVTITNLYVDLIRSAPHQYNISDLLKRSPARRLINYFSLNNIKLEEGTIHFQDIPANRSHVIDDINLSIPFVSNLTADVDIWVKPHFSAVINGSPITLTGETKPFYRLGKPI